MKPVLISSVKLIGWVSQLVFFVVLAGVFLFMAVYFDLLGQLSSVLEYSLYLEYILIGVVAWLFAFVIYMLIKSYQIKKMALIVFSVKMELDKSYNYVTAPSGMLVSEFLKQYFIFLMRGSLKERYQAILNKNIPLLEINRKDEIIRSNGTSTLLAAGLKDGDICQVVGKPKEVF